MRRNAIECVREWNDGGNDLPPSYSESREFQVDVRDICDAAEQLTAAREAIAHFLIAVDKGFLGRLPDDFNRSAFVTSLRAAASTN